MLSYQKNTVKTSVRKLVEFLLRSGDIDMKSQIAADVDAMQEGSRLHRKIQRAKPTTYQSEVSLKMSWQKDGYELVLEGRADGIDTVEYQGEKTVCIDEIKCVYRDVTQIEEAEPLHLAQAKCYAYMYGIRRGLSKCMVQLTYCNMETEELTYITRLYTMEELSAWFEGLMESYSLWAEYCVRARKERNESIEKLLFPFPFRPGQKKLTALVYQTIEKSRSVYLQAPTGVGKTISVLYPSIKEIGREQGEKIFYLTAKTITRTVAEQTLGILKGQGLSMLSVSITAKDKICTNVVRECNPDSCPLAKGHYDRINEALYALLAEKRQVQREDILEYSEKYQVCPYELSLESAMWADCIICDYNYAFDPHVNKKSLFGEKSGGIFLIDEAHNLPDRAREMYSAVLSRKEVLEIKRIFANKSKKLEKQLKKCNHVLLQIEKEPEMAEKNIDRLYYPLFWMLGEMEEYLKEHAEMEEKVVEFYYKTRHFFMMLDTMGEGYQIYGEKKGGRLLLHLLCVNPSARLEEYWNRCRSGIFFSATLLPVPYFKKLLGSGKDTEAFHIPSPFSKENRLLMISSDVTSRYSQRNENQYQKIAQYLQDTLEEKKGNYMVFFPSYQMLSETYERVMKTELPETAELLLQETMMGEQDREDFLKKFTEDRKKPLLAFCVLGSIFSEGIDLTGRRLIGVMIVGTGIPQVCEEREQIRSFFDRQGKKGYDYAYRYPGMNKVLQAAGRVIRTADDVGMILLMDERFLWRENQELLPAEWDSYYPVNLSNYKTVVKQFWEKHEDEI
ncbi:MAG: ATP-dependent DNA helicase [Eubacteriales bacterium]|nr:ATP-dependent DNA helicase [Eubacteriales bacterium]